MSAGAALLVVDVQNDFCPGGALAVPGGDRVVPVLNQVITTFAARGLPIYTSRDWHPPDTRHFRALGGPWPPHCVVGSAGAAFHPDLDLSPAVLVITKGVDRNDNGYSAFEGRTPDGGSLVDDLRRRAVTHLYVGGLATDYCVKHSVLDARKAGFEVTVIEDAIAAVEVHPGDAAAAVDLMIAAGARLAPASRVLAGL